MNSTATNAEIHHIMFFLGAWVCGLGLLILILFVGVNESSNCGILSKFIKIKCLKCCGKHRALEREAVELQDIVEEI